MVNQKQPAKETPQGVYDTRLAKLDALRRAGVDPYPAKASRTHEISTVRANFKKLEKDTKSLSLVGRLMTFRQHGGISFANLRDGTGELQIAFQEDVLGKIYESVSDLDMGDFVEVTGKLFVTKRGEETLSVSSYRILAKSLRPLPEKWHGLKDPEERYRRRYLDMIANPVVHEKLQVRAKIVSAIRTFLDARRFFEIENPVLETVASGAAAKPFQTHINAYDLDAYLRIAVGELWQKRSLIGGFEKVYEIGRAFRNEGVDFSHNPDFTMLEYYWAYADYEDNIKLHEEMIPAVVKGAVGDLKLEHEKATIDFKAPYPRKTFREALLDETGVDIDRFLEGDLINGFNLNDEIKTKTGLDYSHLTGNRILDDFFKDTIRSKQIQPIFITHYPAILKPLAKRAKKNEELGVDDRYAEMFQLMVATMELSNSYSELNDPVDQRKRFELQAMLAGAGDDEAMADDPDFLEALEYGMPPATGTGIGIDRFAALLTNSHSIREVTAYPLMKPKGKHD